MRPVARSSGRHFHPQRLVVKIQGTQAEGFPRAPTMIEYPFGKTTRSPTVAVGSLADADPPSSFRLAKKEHDP